MDWKLYYLESTKEKTGENCQACTIYVMDSLIHLFWVKKQCYVPKNSEKFKC